MNKCLVTKLKGVVNNDSLPILGGMFIKINKVDTPTPYTQSIGLSVDKPVKIKIIGEGFFTDKGLTENKGKEITYGAGSDSKIFVSNEDVTICVLDKYSISQIQNWDNSLDYPTKQGTNKSFQLADLKYCTNLLSINFESNGVIGDIAELKYAKTLVLLVINGNYITGNLSSLKNLSNLQTLSLSNTKINGDLSSLSNLTNLTSISIPSTYIAGDLSSLSNLRKLKNFYIDGTLSSPITGDVSSLNQLVELTYATITYGKFTGDLAKLPVKLKQLIIYGTTKSTVTWSSRPSSSTIVSINGNIFVDNVDKMLQDLSLCQVPENVSTKIISIHGSRTSASDAAVQTLQSKGYAVSITPA